MRFLYGVRSNKSLEKELSLVLEVLYSNVFIYLDLLIFSFFLTYILFPLHGSIGLAIGIFLVFSSLFLVFYSYFDRRFKD